MKSTTKSLLLAAGFLLLPAVAANASVDSILRVDLECFYQKSLSSSANNDYGSVGRTRINSKHLIALIGRAMDRRFPDGAQLKVAVDGRVFVSNSKGDVIVNASRYIQVNFEADERLFDGKINHKTGVENSRNFFPVAMTINLPTLKGAVEGVGTEDMQVTAANRVGVQIATAVLQTTASGKGELSGKPALFTGKLNFNGREALLSD
jgi:hypothetical protein